VIDAERVVWLVLLSRVTWFVAGLLVGVVVL
jgi:hypothetical protein